ncbi:MAG: SpoIIE family protein phosphatase [Leptospirales bacterium]|nr:SpoIIE family protein phosphatase [Leptospirales bacterium]
MSALPPRWTRAIALLAAIAVTPLSAAPIELSDDFEMLDLATAADYAITNAGESRPEQALHMPEGAAPPSHFWFGLDRKEVWLRVRLFYNGAGELPLSLVQPTARIDHVDFYVFDEEGRLRAQSRGGDSASEDSEELRPLLEFEAPARQQLAIVIRLQNAVDLAAASVLYRRDRFEQFAARQMLLQSALFGPGLLLAFLFAAAAFHFPSARIAHYVFFLLIVNIYFFFGNGFPELIVGRLPPFLANQGYYCLAALVFCSGLRFARSVMDLAKEWPAADRYLTWVQYGTLIPIALAPVSRELCRLASDSTAIIAGPAALVVALPLARRSIHARYFAIGWALPILGGVLDNWFGGSFDPGDRELRLEIAVFLGFCVLALQVGRELRLLARDQAATNARASSLEQDLWQACEIHQGLLPQSSQLPKIPRLGVHYQPQSQLGGDFYDVATLDDGRVGILLADVTGHGLAAALDASSVRLAFRTSYRDCASPGELLSRMNRILTPHIEYRFISAVYILFDPKTGIVSLSCAGHPAPLLLRPNGRITFHGMDALVLGLSADTHYGDLRLQLQSGDILFLYTDGLYEDAESVQDEPQTELARVAAALDAEDRKDVSQAIARRCLQQRGGRQSDDITVLSVQWDGASPTANESQAGSAAYPARPQ